MMEVKMPDSNKSTQSTLFTRLPVKLIAIQSALALSAVGICVATALHSKTRLLQMGQSIGLPENHVYFTFVNQQGAALSHDLLIAASITSILVVTGFAWLSTRVQDYQSKNQPTQGSPDGDSLEQTSVPSNVVNLKKVA